MQLECALLVFVCALGTVRAYLYGAAGMQTAGAVFGADMDTLSIKVVMRKLSRSLVRRQRASAKASFAANKPGKTLTAKKNGGCCDWPRGVWGDRLDNALTLCRPGWVLVQGFRQRLSCGQWKQCDKSG